MNDTKLFKFRENYPQYNDRTDEELINAIKRKYPVYSDIEENQLITAIENKLSKSKKSPLQNLASIYGKGITALTGLPVEGATQPFATGLEKFVTSLP